MTTSTIGGADLTRVVFAVSRGKGFVIGASVPIIAVYPDSGWLALRAVAGGTRVE